MKTHSRLSATPTRQWMSAPVSNQVSHPLPEMSEAELLVRMMVVDSMKHPEKQIMTIGYPGHIPMRYLVAMACMGWGVKETRFKGSFIYTFHKLPLE